VVPPEKRVRAAGRVTTSIARPGGHLAAELNAAKPSGVPLPAGPA